MSRIIVKPLKILCFSSSYPDPAWAKPYDYIFVKEHIISVAPYCQSRVVYIPSDQPSGNKMVEIVISVEDNIPTDCIFFKTIQKIHHKRLRELDLVPFIQRPEDLLPPTLKCLKEPEWCKEKSRRLVKDYVYFTDRSSTERLIQYIKEHSMEI